MQFAAPDAAIDAICERLKHPVFGYTMNFDDQLSQAFHAWCVERYDWRFAREEMQVSLGVIPALFGLVEYVCQPGDKVLSLTPAEDSAHGQRVGPAIIADGPTVVESRTPPSRRNFALPVI
jgi:bifunctional pyridoxal-dependent enzyme with beta-cystathionase and maltose regulon repressor activities